MAAYGGSLSVKGRLWQPLTSVLQHTLIREMSLF